MVGRQLHHERRRLAREELRLLEGDAAEDDDRDAREVHRRRHPPVVAEEARGEHRDDHGLRAAGHEGGEDDRHALVAHVLDRARRHDGRHAATLADEHRDEALAAEAEAAEEAVHDERDARHVAAVLQEREEEEDDRDDGHEAEHRADAADEAVVDERVGQRALDDSELLAEFAAERRDAGNPHAELARFRLADAGARLVERFVARPLHLVAVVLVLDGNHALVDLHVARADLAGLLVLQPHLGLDRLREVLVEDLERRRLERFAVRPGPERLRGLLVERREVLPVGPFALLGVVGGRVGGLPLLDVRGVGREGAGGLLPVHAVVPELLLRVRRRLGLVHRPPEVPAVAEEAVVGPVGEVGAGTAVRDGKPVHREEREAEDRDGEDAVRDEAVDLVRERRALHALRVLHDARGDELLDEGVALGGDDRLRVVVQLGFAVLDVALHVREHVGGEAHLRDGVRIALEDLDRAPAEGGGGHLALDRLLDVRDRVFHGPREHVRHLALAPVLRVAERELGGLAAPPALLRADAHDLAVEALFELREVDLVARALHEVHHVDGHHHRHADLGELRSEVEVALDVHAVHDVQDRGRLLVHEEVARDLLLQRVGGERVDARQVLHDDVLVPLEPAVLLLHRHARPVPDVLVGSRQLVEERRLAAVRVARKRNLHCSIGCHDKP